MKNDQFLIKLAKIVDDLDANGFYQEAYFLNNEYIKLAQSFESNEEEPENNIVDDATKAVGVAALSKKILTKAPKVPKGKIPFGRPSLKGMGIQWILEQGENFALDYFESSQGPYKVYSSNKSDMDKIIKVIGKLVPDMQLTTMLDNLSSVANEGMEKFDQAKSEIRTAYNLKLTQNIKIAVRGNAEDQMPEYLRKFLVNATAAGVTGGILSGGAAVIPAALIGGVKGLAEKGAEDLWYANISSTGKAYLQSKDLSDKASKMFDALKDIDANLANQLVDHTTDILEYVEKINLNNKEKTQLENLVHKAEQTLGQTGKALGQTGKLIKEKITESDQSIPFERNDGRVRIL